MSACDPLVRARAIVLTVLDDLLQLYRGNISRRYRVSILRGTESSKCLVPEDLLCWPSGPAVSSAAFQKRGFYASENSSRE